MTKENKEKSINEQLCAKTDEALPPNPQNEEVDDNDEEESDYEDFNPNKF